ncbi:MAG TPA: DUF6114 domain-containing protein, partial [Rugosimonospora sp.]|nr:DUF6114 domain-containing protein [Rugosimonospora sp.]
MTAADEPRPTTDTTGDPGITEAPAITEVPGDAEAPGIAEPPGRAERAWQGFLRGWRAFRRWRRGRPFWGGLITIIAGLEYYFSVHLDPTSISVSFGQQGFLAWLIPLVLVLCGLLGWFTPAQRIFYGIVAAGTAVYGLIAVNIGGFFLGMLIGILGGSLIAAWFPARRPPVAATPGAAADADPSVAAAGLDADTANLPRVEDEVPAGPGSARHAVVPTEEGPRSRVRWRHRGGRGAALVLVPLAVLAIGVGAVQRAVPAYAAPSTCGSAEPVAPAGTPTSAATAPTTPATSPSPAATGGGGGGVIGGILGAIGDALDKLL